MPRRTIHLYLFFTFLQKFGQAFIFATYTVFLLSRGLNLFETNLVNFTFYATLFLFEVPTGAIADVFGRKVSFVLSCFLGAASAIIYATSTHIVGFILAEVVGAIAGTFASGAFQAWLVDRLNYQKYDGSLGPIFSREQQVSSAALIFGALLGAWIGNTNLAYPWLGSGIVLLVTGVLAWLLMREEYFTPKPFSLAHGVSSIRETIRVSLAYGSKHTVVRFILIMGLLQAIAIQAANMQWQPFFAPSGSNMTSLGFIFAGIALATMLGATLAPKLLRIITSEPHALLVSQWIIGLGIATTVLVRVFPLALAIFLVHEIGRGLFGPTKDAYLNRHIPSETRATIISFEAMARHIGGMIGLLASGALAQSFGIPTTWVIAGTFLVLATLLFIPERRPIPVPLS